MAEMTDERIAAIEEKYSRGRYFCTKCFRNFEHGPLHSGCNYEASDLGKDPLDLIAALRAARKRIAELSREAACPCCRGGINLSGEPCTECSGKGLAIIAYEHGRYLHKRQSERIAELEARIAELENALNAVDDEILGWQGICSPDRQANEIFNDLVNHLIKGIEKARTALSEEEGGNG